jgi:hypothetical protein
MISVEEILSLEKKRKIIKKEIYTKIYEDISRKIRSAVSIGHKQIIVRVPSYLFGYPTYDHSKASIYMKRQLEHSGFFVTVLSPGELYISWKREEKKQTPLPKYEQHAEEDEDFPTFVNLKKIANKLRKQ